MSKNVIIFSTAYYPFIGGAEVAIKEITNRIDDFDFDLITSKFNKTLPREEKIGNINIYRVGFGNRFDKFLLPVFGFFLALKLNKKRNYCLNWCIMASQASIASSFFKIIKKNIPLLLTIQEGDKENHLKRYVLGNNFLYKLFIQPWHRLVFKLADFVQAISNDLKERSIKNGAKCEVKVIPNAVNIANFSKKYSKEELKQLKQKLNKKDKDVFLITTSRLVKKNAVDDVIKAMKYLPNNIKFIVLGKGDDEEYLKKLAQKEKVEERLEFLGLIKQNELPKYLRISDIFIRPSLSEGLGNSFLEAMAVGIPVIATPVGGIPDFLFDNKTGFFCQVKNPQSIAKIVQFIINKKNREKVEKVIRNAQKMIYNKYDWNIIANDMLCVFYQIIK